MAIEKGKLVRWFDDKGFGFIKPENGKNDIFIHISTLKNMNRKPIVGDIILYEINFDSDGKQRVINAIIEGVSQSLTLTPLEKKSKATLPPIKTIPHSNNTPVSRHKKSRNLFPLLIVIGTAVFIYNKISKEKVVFDPIKTFELQPITVEQSKQFQCQGKIYCSEMSSYDEAIFYLHNCPGTKMDGDGDGEPCEQQF
jgi:cold shock CspA family protein